MHKNAFSQQHPHNPTFNSIESPYVQETDELHIIYTGITGEEIGPGSLSVGHGLLNYVSSVIIDTVKSRIVTGVPPITIIERSPSSYHADIGSPFGATHVYVKTPLTFTLVDPDSGEIYDIDETEYLRLGVRKLIVPKQLESYLPATLTRFMAVNESLTSK